MFLPVAGGVDEMIFKIPILPSDSTCAGHKIFESFEGMFLLCKTAALSFPEHRFLFWGHRCVHNCFIYLYGFQFNTFYFFHVNSNQEYHMIWWTSILMW